MKVFSVEVEAIGVAPDGDGLSKEVLCEQTLGRAVNLERPVSLAAHNKGDSTSSVAAGDHTVRLANGLTVSVTRQARPPGRDQLVPSTSGPVGSIEQDREDVTYTIHGSDSFSLPGFCVWSFVVGGWVLVSVVPFYLGTVTTYYAARLLGSLALSASTAVSALWGLGSSCGRLEKIKTEGNYTNKVERAQQLLQYLLLSALYLSFRFFPGHSLVPGHQSVSDFVWRSLFSWFPQVRISRTGCGDPTNGSLTRTLSGAVAMQDEGGSSDSDHQSSSGATPHKLYLVHPHGFFTIGSFLFQGFRYLERTAPNGVLDPGASSLVNPPAATTTMLVAPFLTKLGGPYVHAVLPYVLGSAVGGGERHAEPAGAAYFFRLAQRDLQERNTFISNKQPHPRHQHQQHPASASLSRARAAAILIPGGFNEIGLARDVVYFQRRKRVIELALQSGPTPLTTEVIPVYTDGEVEECYGQKQLSFLLSEETRRYLHSRRNVPTAVAWSRWFPAPNRVGNLHILVGDDPPLLLPRIEKPSREEIDYWHNAYHLTALLGQASLIAELEVRDQETNAGGVPALDKSASDVAENDRGQDEEIHLNQNEAGNNEQPDDASPSATSQNGTHEIEVRYPCPLCRGEAPLCVTVADPYNSAERLFANATRTMDSLRDRLLDPDGELAAAALQRILGRMIDLVSLHSPPDGMSPSGGEDPGDASPGTSEGGDLVYDEEVVSETGDNSNRNSRGSTSTNSFRGERTPQWITGWLQSGTSSAVRSVAGDVSPRPMSPGASGARNVSAVLATRSSHDNQPRGEPPVSSSRPPSASGAAFVPTMTGSTGSRVVPGYTTGGYTPEVFLPRSSAMVASRPQSRGSLFSIDSSSALGGGGLGGLLNRNWADWVDANAGRTTPRVTGVSIGRRPRARQLGGTAPARSLRETPRQ
eukprot:g3931.t1